MKVSHFRWLFAVLSILLWTAGFVLSSEPIHLGLWAEWSSKDGYVFAAGTAPWALGFSVLITSLYFLLMNTAPADSGRPLPGIFRRFLAFWLDFGLVMSILAPILGVLPVLVEWGRTKVFAWTFERTTLAASDIPLAALSTAVALAMMMLYFAIPIFRQRPSPGSCIVGYQVVPEGGAALTLRRALLRTSLGFLAVCGAWAAPFVARDRRHGKFWLDRVFGTRAMLLD
jgi:hypothetical protein